MSATAAVVVILVGIVLLASVRSGAIHTAPWKQLSIALLVLGILGLMLTGYGILASKETSNADRPHDRARD